MRKLALRIAAPFFLLISATWSITATVYHTPATPISEIMNNLQPGDAVKFDEDNITVPVTRDIEGVQFIGGKSHQWVISADIVNCDFIGHNVKLFKQNSGKLRKCGFYFTHYGNTGIELYHADSVCFFFAGNFFKPAAQPRLQLYGFVRSVTIHKPVLEPDIGEADFSSSFAPVVRIAAWDPVGNGQGTYIISPIIWDGRANTYFHIVRGNGITFAHCNTEYNRWSDPIAHFDNTTNSVLLCNGVGCAKDANNSAYKTQPSVLQYADYKQLGHYEDAAPFRGAAFRMGGMMNKSVASGSYKTWTIGMKAWLPSLHYDDAITVRDPWFEDWCWQRGTATVGFSEIKSHFMFGESELKQYGDPRYPVDGANLISPYLRRFPQNILARQKAGKRLGPTKITAIKRLLEAGKTVELAAGTYVFDKTLRNGEIIGAGPNKTVIKFLGKQACATDAFRGYSNCTVTGGSWGFVNSGYVLGSKFFRTVFRDHSEGGILINDNSQNDCIQDAEFHGGKYGIKTGSNGNPVDPNIDKLDIVNCHFEGQSIKGIELYTDPEKVKNGQVAVHGCSFKDIGGAAIHINGTQTHLVQQCTIDNACHSSTERAAVNIESYKDGGAVAISHVTITGNNAAATGITFGGEGAISHCKISGMGTAVRVTGKNAVVDHIDAPEGELSVADGASVYLARSNLKNATCGINDTKIRIYSGASFQEHEGSGVNPQIAPPAPVTDVSVERKTNDPDYPYLKDYNLITWDPVSDPGSTIIGYAIFANGVEVGRTTAWRANGSGEVLRGERSEPPTTGAPADYELVRTEFRDPNIENTHYTVKPINGAHMFPDGSIAPERQWTQPWGYFMTPDGKEFRVDKIDYVNNDTRWVEDTTRGLRLNAAQDGQLMANEMPTYITHDWGDFSVASNIPIPTRVAADYRKTTPAAGAPMLIGRFLHLPSASNMTVELLDPLGRRVAVLVDGALNAGVHQLSIPHDRLGSGTYIISIRTPGHSLCERIGVVR